MSITHDTRPELEKSKEEKRLPYRAPAIIYHGIIKTRAGSPAGLSDDSEESVVDPADLFGNGS